MAQPQPVPRRSLADKLAQLKVLSAADLRAIEIIVDDVLERRTKDIEHSDLWRKG